MPYLDFYIKLRARSAKLKETTFHVFLTKEAMKNFESFNYFILVSRNMYY
jgi:hypothetical protein